MKRSSISRGLVFVDGYLAGIAGYPRRANPHRPRSPSALLWGERWGDGSVRRAEKETKPSIPRARRASKNGARIFKDSSSRYTTFF